MHMKHGEQDTNIRYRSDGILKDINIAAENLGLVSFLYPKTAQIIQGDLDFIIGNKDMKTVLRFICMILMANLMISFAEISPATAKMSMSPQIKEELAYDRHPLCFEANQGQTDASVKFIARGKGYTLFFYFLRSRVVITNAYIFRSPSA